MTFNGKELVSLSPLFAAFHLHVFEASPCGDELHFVRLQVVSLSPAYGKVSADPTHGHGQTAARQRGQA